MSSDDPLHNAGGHLKPSSTPSPAGDSTTLTSSSSWRRFSVHSFAFSALLPLLAATGSVGSPEVLPGIQRLHQLRRIKVRTLPVLLAGRFWSLRDVISAVSCR
ncbi:hypothetical protein T459_13508 [Capsicum annuum]|uniref:Uncharacterized protein n=1 Tax=Capsicum annuum TaxID=4072 RepID=A0A2G2ZSW8_CAPAN|nr:hypothetical protein T459_13508 [Capsicum annuum]